MGFDSNPANITGLVQPVGVAWTVDGDTIVTVTNGTSPALNMWLADGRRVASTNLTGSGYGMAACDGRRLVAVGGSNESEPTRVAALYSAEDASWNFGLYANWSLSVRTVGCASRAPLLAGGTAEGAWVVANLSSRTILLEGNSTVGAIRSIGLTPDGALLALGHSSGGVEIVSVESGAPLVRLEPSLSSPAVGLQFSPDGGSLAVSILSVGTRIFNVSTWAAAITLPTAESIGAVAWSPSGDVLATAAGGSQVSLWNPISGQVIQSLAARHSPVLGVDWAANGQRLVTWGAEGVARVWVNSTDILNVRIDPAQVPLVSIDQPQPYAVITGTLVVSGTASSPRPLLAVLLGMDDQPSVAASGTSSWVGVLDMSNITKGFHKLRAQAFDELLSSSTTSITFSFEPELPREAAPQLIIETPLNDTTVGGEVLLAGRIEGLVTNGSVAYRVDDGPWIQLAGLKNWSGLLGTYGLANGLHTIAVQAILASSTISGNTTQVWFNNPSPRSNLAPAIQVHSPTNASTAYGLMIARGIAEDDGPVVAVFYRWDWGTWMMANGTSTWDANLSTANLVDGWHTASFRAWDGVYFSRTASLVLLVQNSAPNADGPTLVVTSPSEGTVVSGMLLISGVVVNARGPSTAVVRLDEIPISEAQADGNWTVVIDSRLFKEGHHVLRIWAVQGDRLSNIVEIGIVIHNGSLQPVPASDLMGLLALSLSIVGATAYGASDRRRRWRDFGNDEGARRRGGGS